MYVPGAAVLFLFAGVCGEDHLGRTCVSVCKTTLLQHQHDFIVFHVPTGEWKPTHRNVELVHSPFVDPRVLPRTAPGGPWHGSDSRGGESGESQGQGGAEPCVTAKNEKRHFRQSPRDCCVFLYSTAVVS